MDVLSAKMVILIFNVFFLPRSMESHVCTSKNDALSCICKNKDNFRMNSSSTFNIRLIHVSECGVVNIPFGVVTQLQLEKVVFSNIYRLIVEPFAFTGALLIATLEIENIQVLNVSTDGFTGLFDVSDIIIRNISSVIVQEQGFGGISSVENFIIQDSNFIEIKRNAFIITNVTNFHVSHSNISLNSNSFLIHSAKSVSFHNCSIQEAKELSFLMASVETVRFSDCNFGFLNTSSIHIKHLQNFQFERCTVSELNRYAFCLPALPKDFKFTHNSIKFCNGPPVYFGNETSSIIIDSKLSIFTSGNFFLCDCDVYWMWTAKPFFDRKSNFCIGTNISLSNIMPRLDSSGNCKALETKNLTTDSNESSNDEEDRYVSSQAVSAGTLLKMPFWCFRLVVFICSL